MCSGAIINSRIKRVVYGAKDPKAGCFAIIIGIILGGMAEQNFVGSLIMSDGNFNIFYTRPLCLFFLVAAVLSLLSPVLGKLFKKA